MKKLNIQSKIRLSFSILFVVMLVVTIYLILQMNTMGEQTRLLYEHPYQVSNTLREIKSEIYLNQNLVRNIRFADNDHQLDSIKAEIDKKDKAIQEGFKIVSLQFLGSKALADSTIAAYTALDNSYDKFYQLKKENKTDSIQILIQSDTRVKFEKTVFLLTKISDFAQTKAESSFKKVIEAENNSTHISIILIIVSGLVVTFFIWYLSRSITRPITKFVGEANILLKKDEKASSIADEQVLAETLAELENAFLFIEKQSREIELRNSQLALINIELEEKVKQRTAELSNANNELAIQNESSRQLASIVESSEDAIISKSLDGTIKSWNHAAVKMFDYTAEEAIGQNISLIIPHEYINDEKNILDKIRKGEFIEHYETVRMKKNGEQFHVSLTVSSIKDSEGKITSVSKIIRDITQRIKGEEKFAASEMRYRRLFESAKDGILILEAETGMIVDVNPFMIKMLGYSHKEYLGKSIWDVGHFKDIVANKANFLELQQKEYIRYEDLPLETSGGQIVHVEFVSNVYLVNEQKVVQCNIRDISERKKKEEAFKEMQDKLLQSEDLYRSLFDKMLNGFAYCKMEYVDGKAEDFTYIHVNSNFQKLTGLKDVEGKKFSEIIPGVKNPSPELVEIYGRVALTGMPETFETFLQPLDMWFFISVYSPKKEYFVAVFDVITDRKKAEEKLNISLENLKLSNKDLEQFAYVANHDLQEPLRMISSYSQLLERKYKDKLDQDANDYIQFVVNGASRMQRLLNDLLEYSKINKPVKGFEQVDTSTVLGQVMANLQLLITANTALITNDDLPVITADETQILRVFQNLIENAIKFKNKTELPLIHISCTRQKNMYQFSVADNGIGMEMQYHDRVFIIFQRLHSVKDYPGTGIGLSICKRIVERHGGTIWYESAFNEGTTFYFTIPV